MFCVVSGRFAQTSSIAGDVEEVVDQLKGPPELATKACQSLPVGEERLSLRLRPSPNTDPRLLAETFSITKSSVEHPRRTGLHASTQYGLMLAARAYLRGAGIRNVSIRKTRSCTPIQSPKTNGT